MADGKERGGRGKSPRILITGGPTVEDVDPVRFLSNRSSGRMGLALAGAAVRAGCETRLILGPTQLEPPAETNPVRVRSAAEMLAAVLDNLSWADALIMAAAVADYTPAEPSGAKLKKGKGELFLRLKRTDDILLRVGARPERRGMCLVGFSLDVSVNLEEGRRKQKDKGLDLMLVNSAESFGSGLSRAWLLSAAGEEDCGLIAKEKLAERIVERV
ncbi:MAG: phosphopantothenoylcysteine decarboxylase, partial [Planctomycetota bacterium]|nr:phosphopantothenoylcysteine decarboxylase [Planctomycetota bacterium]